MRFKYKQPHVWDIDSKTEMIIEELLNYNEKIKENNCKLRQEIKELLFEYEKKE